MVVMKAVRMAQLNHTKMACKTVVTKAVWMVVMKAD